MIFGGKSGYEFGYEFVSARMKYMLRKVEKSMEIA